MTHYDVTRWIDYLHGLVEAKEHSVMTSHLAECSSCRQTHDLFARVVVCTHADLCCEIPEAVIRKARAVFRHKATPRAVLRKLTCSLVFDSFQQPALAGARSGTTAMRHALYEAGDYSVDIRLETERGSGQVNMVGQLALRSQTGDLLDGAPVLLLRGRTVVAEAVSNQFGEFQLSYEPNSRLKLQVAIQERAECIELLLGSLMPKPGRNLKRRSES